MKKIEKKIIKKKIKKIWNKPFIASKINTVRNLQAFLLIKSRIVSSQPPSVSILIQSPYKTESMNAFKYNPIYKFNIMQIRYIFLWNPSVFSAINFLKKALQLVNSLKTERIFFLLHWKHAHIKPILYKCIMCVVYEKKNLSFFIIKKELYFLLRLKEISRNERDMQKQQEY